MEEKGRMIKTNMNGTGWKRKANKENVKEMKRKEKKKKKGKRMKKEEI